MAALVALVWRAERRRRDAERERALLDGRLVQLDDRDPLSGAIGSRRLDEELWQALALAQRNRTRVAVLAGGKLIRSLRGVKRPKPDGALIDMLASIGLALSDPSSVRGSQELLAAAELALADAKPAGGNRFAVVDSLVLD